MNIDYRTQLKFTTKEECEMKMKAFIEMMRFIKIKNGVWLGFKESRVTQKPLQLRITIGAENLWAHSLNDNCCKISWERCF